MKPRELLQIDYFLLLSSLILVVFGIFFIYSSGISIEGVSLSNEYRRQIIWAGFSLVVALVISFFNYRKVYNLSIWFYLSTIVLLLLTLAIDTGGSRWIRIGSFGFLQTSEFAKISTIIFLAWYLDHTKRKPHGFLRFLFSCIIVFIPMALVLVQPDLGTALVFIPILLGMAFISGISLRYIIFLVLSIVFTAMFLLLPFWQTIMMENRYPALMIFSNRNFIAVSCISLLLVFSIAIFGYLRFHKRYFYWISYSASILFFSLAASFGAQRVLREYQLMRLVVFMNPNVDPRGSGWHIIQSITAIGSGGAFGRGYLQGTQSQYRFLPEQSTDFIFSILSEEWGFRGGIILFSLFLVIILRLIRIIRITNDTYGSYIVAGLATMYAFHFFINVGMAMGIMPITGIPLMFVSYGGSSLMTAMIGIGLAMSIHIRRHIRHDYGMQ